jgi:pimeloyl-ACP methyl ester carboxylesterase
VIVEEEMLPGIAANVAPKGAAYYPDWHAAVLRAPGLAEQVLRSNFDEFVRAFLVQSAGPGTLPSDQIERYVATYASAGIEVTAGYYRTGGSDREAFEALMIRPIRQHVLAIGGEFGMGRGVYDSCTQAADTVEYVEIPEAGHYPAEQNASLFIDAVSRGINLR